MVCNFFAALALAGAVAAQTPAYGQCGGTGFTGSTTCVSGYTCLYTNEWYSQCVPGSGGGTTARTTTTRAGQTTVQTTTRAQTTTRTTSAGGSTQTGGSSGGSYPLEGYGAGTTGGGSGSGTTVTSCSALSSALSSGGVVKISGILSGCGILNVKSSTTVIGVGSNSGMTLGGLKAKGQSNIIIRNLKFYLANEGDDLLAFDSTTKIWVDHCEFYNAGITGDKDYYDGLLDITHACDYVTVSWCKFHDHWKGSLVGHSDSNASEDTGKLHVTYHHNYWQNVNSRLPSIRFGTGHVYSSCFVSCPTSGINSRMGAKVLVENSSFTDVKLAIVTDLDSDSDGYATERNNLFLGSSTTRITQTGYTAPGYSYTLDSASSVCALTSSKAGTGIVG